jgi:two-component system, cell cycle response regulator
MTELRILLVDDEEFYLRLFSDLLSERGYVIQTARSGEEAFSLLSRRRFDILITDLLMEGMDGLQLAEKVRESFPRVDVVVITQRDDVRLAVRAMKMGVFEYLVKPVDQEELLLTLDRLLERRHLIERQNKLMDESMEYLQAQTVYRHCLDLLSTLDLDNLCEAILRHMSSAIGAQGGILWLISPEEQPETGVVEKLNLAWYRGLIALEDVPSTVQLDKGMLAHAFERNIPFLANPAIVLQMQWSDRSGGLFVPLSVGTSPVGLVLVVDKLREDFSERDQNIAKTLAEFSAIAVRNSRRFQALERVGLRDQNVTIYNLTYFIDYAGKEIYKARRYGRSFSLAIGVIDQFDLLRQRLKAEVCSKITQHVAENIGRVIRDSDILAKVSEHEYYILLPETDGMGARMFIRRCQEAFQNDPLLLQMKQELSVHVTLGAGSYPADGDDFDQLLSACRDEMAKARLSLFRRMDLADKNFWSVVEVLAGNPGDDDLSLLQASGSSQRLEAEDGSSARGCFSGATVDGIEEQVSKLAVGPPAKKAILYSLGGDLGADLRPVERMMTTGAELARAFVLGKKSDEIRESVHSSVTRVFVDDEPVERSRIFLALNEQTAYAFIGRSAPSGNWRGFHTSDRVLVENLIAKLQDHYHLQRQY